MTIAALLLAAGVVGGHLYAAKFEVRGAHVTVWRYAAAGTRRGPPVVVFGELGFGRASVGALAAALQDRGREVFVPDWRGTGASTGGPPALAGLQAMLEGDARAALEAALGEGDCAQLVGVGLGGAAAYLLADRACAVVAVNVPARWEVPDEAVRRLIAAMRPAAEEFGALGPWLSLPSPLDSREGRDLGELLLGLRPQSPLRSRAGRVAPQLAREVLEWMQGGPFAQRLSAAADGLAVPLLLVSSPRDNLVHPEHALLVKAKHDQLVLSRIEGYADDHPHLPLPPALFHEIASWLESH